jgi:hypothetical protein
MNRFSRCSTTIFYRKCSTLIHSTMSTSSTSIYNFQNYSFQSRNRTIINPTKQQSQFSTNSSSSNSSEKPLKPPIRPIEPVPESCCGNGCSPCVYEIYYDDLDQYKVKIYLIVSNYILFKLL